MASTPANHSALLNFIKGDWEAIIRKIDKSESEEMKVSQSEARTHRSQMVARNKKLLADDA